MKMFKKTLIATAIGVALIATAGCALTGGETAYTIEPVNGVCCKVTVNNTKDYDKLKFRLEKRADGSISVSLDESGVSSSDPAAVGASNVSRLIGMIPVKL